MRCRLERHFLHLAGVTYAVGLTVGRRRSSTHVLAGQDIKPASDTERPGGLRLRTPDRSPTA